MPAQLQTQTPPAKWSSAVLAGFVVVAVLAGLPLFLPLWKDSGWPDAMLVIFASAATIAALAKQLPVLNVIFAAGIAAGLGGMAHAVNDVTGFPFGKFEFTAALGPRLLGVLPLAVPALWAIAGLNARGAARLLLRDARQHPHHGYRVIALAVLLMTGFHVALEPVATVAKGWWTANPTPLLALTNWVLLSLAIQIAVTPLLIDKFPLSRPPNYSPVFVWIALNGLLAASLFVAGLIVGALLAAAVGVILAALAWRIGRATVPRNADKV